MIRNVKYLYFIGLLFFFSCENNEKDLPSFRKKQISIDEGKQITAYMSEDAKVKAKLTSPYMLRNEMDSPYVEFPRTLHVDFYNDSMVVESVLDALYGKWKESEDKIFLRDSVVVKNILKGDTLHCRELWWDQKKQKFYTDKPVRIHKKGGTIIYGTGLEAPQDFSGYTIFQITGPFAFPENGFGEKRDTATVREDSTTKKQNILPKQASVPKPAEPEKLQPFIPNSKDTTNHKNFFNDTSKKKK